MRASVLLAGPPVNIEAAVIGRVFYVVRRVLCGLLGLFCLLDVFFHVLLGFSLGSLCFLVGVINGALRFGLAVFYRLVGRFAGLVNGLPGFFLYAGGFLLRRLFWCVFAGDDDAAGDRVKAEFAFSIAVRGRGRCR